MKKVEFASKGNEINIIKYVDKLIFSLLFASFICFKTIKISYVYSLEILNYTFLTTFP